MSEPLRVLMVEDVEDDALLLIRALENGGYDPEYERVETIQAMRTALREKPWDVILCDYRLPKFNGLAAIALLKETAVDIPLIVVSGAIGEETAAECMRSGAHDYVRKGDLSRLVPVIERELKEKESRSRRKKAEEALRESEANYRQLFDNSPTAIYQIDFRTGKFLKANDVVCGYLGIGQEEITSLSPYDIMTEESQKLFLERLSKMAMGDKVPEDPEYEIMDKNGKRRWLQLNSKNIYDSEGLAGADVVAHDITERKRAEEALRKSLEQLRRAVETTIQVLVMAVEIKDPYTAGHQRRMTNLARTMATEMGLPPEKIEGLRMAGVIHDIGKITLPTEILSKPTKLSAIELSLIREHVQLGYDILKDVESPWSLAEIVLQHHERMDGSGYPRGRKGDDILIEARILAVADVVEAMASHRPYRAALGLDAALAEIEKNKGTLYDQAVVEVCLRLFREKGYQIEGT
jgi:PAS domain S-box-containing protein